MIGQRGAVRVVREVRRREHLRLPERIDTLLRDIFQSLLMIGLFVHIRNIRVAAGQINRVKILRLLHVERRDLFRQSIVEPGRCIISQVLEISVYHTVDPAILAVPVRTLQLGSFAINRRFAVQADIEDPVRHVQRPELALPGSAPELARRV